MNDKVFLCGIGGIGMVNVAVLLKQAGYDVSGSDGQVYEPAATILREADINVLSPYSAANVPRDRRPIIVGNAQSRGHVEVETALNDAVPMYSFPEFLSRHVLTGRRTMVVAGTHGKSTTSACLAHLLTSSGVDPGFLIGALPLNFNVGGRLGKGDPFVIEGDEYDSAFFDKRSKFLHYFPQTLVLGHVEFDHADIFADLDDMLRSFQRLINLLPRNGKLVFAADCALTTELAARAPCTSISVGEGDNCEWQLLPSTDSLCFRAPDGTERRWKFALPGRHNRLNALMALAAAQTCTSECAMHERAIETFRGLRRRMETLVESNNITVIDDFAHHPTAIRCAIDAVREKYPRRHVTVVCEPRSNSMARNVFQEELKQSFDSADEVIFGSIHRQDRIPVEERLDLDDLVAHISVSGARARRYENDKLLAQIVEEERASPEVIIFLSNGGFDNIPHDYAAFVKRTRYLTSFT